MTKRMFCRLDDNSPYTEIYIALDTIKIRDNVKMGFFHFKTESGITLTASFRIRLFEGTVITNENALDYLEYLSGFSNTRNINDEPSVKKLADHNVWMVFHDLESTPEDYMFSLFQDDKKYDFLVIEDDPLEYRFTLSTRKWTTDSKRSFAMMPYITQNGFEIVAWYWTKEDGEKESKRSLPITYTIPFKGMDDLEYVLSLRQECKPTFSVDSFVTYPNEGDGRKLIEYVDENGYRHFKTDDGLTTFYIDTISPSGYPIVDFS